MYPRAGRHYARRHSVFRCAHTSDPDIPASLLLRAIAYSSADLDALTREIDWIDLMLAPAGRDHLSFRERKDSMRYLGHIDFRRETANLSTGYRLAYVDSAGRYDGASVEEPFRGRGFTAIASHFARDRWAAWAFCIVSDHPACPERSPTGSFSPDRQHLPFAAMRTSARLFRPNPTRVTGESIAHGPPDSGRD